MTRCASCKFWDRDFEDEQGNCRRHAPAAFHSIKIPEAIEYKEFEIVTALWPRTHGEEWCGEYLADPASADKSQLINDFAELGNGARNILKCHGIRTVGDLMAHTHASLLGFPGLGRGSLNQIIHALATVGIKLKINDTD